MTKPPQARNAIKRALAHTAGLKFPTGYITRCKEHFNNSCAYCGIYIDPNSRKAHMDHSLALSEGLNQYHLVYACNECNGDEKREFPWDKFIEKKVGSNTRLLNERKNAILNWFKSETPARISCEKLKILRSAEKASISAFDQEVESLRSHINNA